MISISKSLSQSKLQHKKLHWILKIMSREDISFILTIVSTIFPVEGIQKFFFRTTNASSGVFWSYMCNLNLPKFQFFQNKYLPQYLIPLGTNLTVFLYIQVVSTSPHNRNSFFKAVHNNALYS